ncbi:hypothetical protein [Thalassovita sp.]|uniref:hypothetical protein n=1 Tax=Thalassovita sp. TaxID=1979401 RepID=UPI0028825E86|nr:hypothetical protein [Thalassovita sp.]MDF1802752.1 hypothetical protein [Thalassovita sp.]
MKIIYCAYGASKYAGQLAQSVRSVLAHHPDALIEVHTTPDFAPLLAALPVSVIVGDDVARASDWHDPLMKLRAICRATEANEPFVYLDNDTCVAGSLAGAWNLLGRFDCLGVQSPIHDQRGFLNLQEAPGLTRPAPQVFPEWNGGVLFFAGTDGARRVAQHWLQIQERGISGGGDQWPLAEALWSSGARLHALPANYNCRLPASPVVYGPLTILHADHPDLAQVARILNANHGLRQVVQERDRYAIRLDPQNGQRCF